jgi:uncharacterized iron-regulated membrane protein
MNTTTIPAVSSRWTLRRVLLTIHLWIGLGLGIPLVLIGLTGSILVFEEQLGDLTQPARTAATGEARSLDDILAAARQSAPAGSRPMFLAAPEEEGKMASVRFVAPGAVPGPGGLQVSVDPVSLETFKSPPNGGWLRQVFNLHAQLFVPGRDGRWLIGWFGIAMCILGVSGIIMHWPRWSRWKAAFKVDQNARGARFLRELHGAIGLWCWIVFMAVSASSVYLAYPQTIGDAIRAVLPARDLRLTAIPRVEPVEGAHPANLTEAAEIAATVVPDGTLRFIAMPQRPDQPIRINLGGPGYRHGTPMISVFVDPWRKEAIEVRDPRDYSVGESVIAWMHAVHAGDSFGWPWRILVFISGLLPTIFVGTGLTMWLLERRQAAIRK